MNEDFFQESEKREYIDFNMNLKQGDSLSIQRSYNSYSETIRNLNALKKPFNREKWEEVQEKYIKWRSINNL